MTLGSKRNAIVGLASVGVLAVGIAGLSLYAYHRRYHPNDRHSPRGAPPRPGSSSSSLSSLSSAGAQQEEGLPSGMRAKAMGLLGLLKQKAKLDSQAGRFAEALKGYHDCLDVAGALGSRDGEAVRAAQVARANAVMCYLRMKNFDDALLGASVMLEDKAFPLETDLKVKVLYRRGLAAKALNQKEAALADFRAAVVLSPDQKNPAAEREIATML